MIFLEAFLLSVLMVLFVHTSVSDVKYGIVGNKSLIVALCLGGLCSILYYALYSKDCLYAYSINLAVTIIISVLLYAFGIWGAGDSKLLILTILLYPARLYCIGNNSVASSFLLIAIIFITAFLYTVADTLYLGIRQKNLLRIQKLGVEWKSVLKGFLFLYFVLSLLNRGIAVLLPEYLAEDEILLTAIHFVLILIGMKLEEKANWKAIMFLAAAWGLCIVLSSQFLPGFNAFRIKWSAYLVVVMLLFFRMISDKYNYKTIPVSELRPGMILARGSVLGFVQSKVQGLPSFSTEDLRSRLNQSEVDSINRWAVSKYGQESITIIRKIPFALFISIGTVIFTIVEVMLR